jgi:uncharacterized protein DUF1552
MMIFNKAIPRRTFLRGAGVTLALPLLEAMVPAFASTPEGSAKPALRLAFIYVPNGVAMKNWTPSAEGTTFEWSRVLQPLAPFRDRVVVLSGLNSNAAEPQPGDGEVAPHERAGAAFLTGIHAMKEGGLGVSVDQIAARELGQHTQLASLEIGLHSSDLVGQCERGWNCAYFNTISYRTPTTPLPMENQPRAVFEHLFGDSDSTDAAQRLARIQEQRSVLDMMTRGADRLRQELGSSDSARLGDYLDGIRDIERRIQMAEEQSSRELPTLERPAGIPPTTGEHAKLMFDLQVLAYQSDLTRVVTFMIDHEQSPRPYPEIGIPDGHHPLSHHNGDPEKIEKWSQIATYHVKLLAYFLEKMQSTPDGDGSLLDHSMIVYGGGISDGDTHSHKELPILLAGKGGGWINGGRHIRYPKDTPLMNLHFALLDKVGVHVEKLGDGTGRLELLSV